MAAAAQNGRRRLLPLARTVRRKASLNWSAHGTTGAGPRAEPITVWLSKERQRAASAAAEEEALAYVEVAATAEGGKRPEAERALIGRRPRARGAAGAGKAITTWGNRQRDLRTAARALRAAAPADSPSAHSNWPGLPPLAESERSNHRSQSSAAAGGRPTPVLPVASRKPEVGRRAEGPPLAVRAVSKQPVRQSQWPFHPPAAVA